MIVMVDEHSDPEDFDSQLAEIRRLLSEAYRHYFTVSDGYCKSGEGSISVTWPAFFWDDDTSEVPSVSIYSYVLGPSRQHYFRTVGEALETVRDWHANAMSWESGDWQ